MSETVGTAVDLGLEAAVEGPLPERAVLQRRPWLGILRNALRLTRTRIGLAIVAFIVAIALFGPLIAPHSPTEFVAIPNSAPSSNAVFGADALGRDVWSRFLHGGLTVLWLSVAATMLGVVLGVCVGLVAAYSRNWLDDLLMRGSMVEVLESEYVTMARLKGLPERTVIWRHAVPNAIVPAIQVTALQLAWMAGGVVVVEYVFSYPGIGAALVEAVGNRDMPVVMTVTMLMAGVYVVLNLLADLGTILVTPKLRTAGR